MNRRGRSGRGAKQVEGRGQTKRGRGADDDGWGGFGNYMDAKKSKLNDQFDQDNKGKNSDIFAGVYIYVNGYTRPPSDELRRIMQRHGGRYETYLSKTRVTHIVASNLPNSKFKMARTMPIVKPDWITDSVSAGRRLSHVPYLLLGNQSKLQPGLKSFPSVSSLHKSSSTTSSTSRDDVGTLATAFPVDTTTAADSCNLDQERKFDDGIDAGGKMQKDNQVLSNGNFSDKESFIRNMEYTAVDGSSATAPNYIPNLKGNQNIQVGVPDPSPGTSKSDCVKSHRAIEKPDAHESDLDDDIVYNSDGGDNEIVYNSEEDSPSIPRFEAKLDSGSRLSSHPVKRSRVYALKKSKLLKSESFDSIKSDTSSCDGFSDCLQIDQAAPSRSKSIGSAALVKKTIPSHRNRSHYTETIDAQVSSPILRPVTGSLTAKLYQPLPGQNKRFVNRMPSAISSFAETPKPVVSLNPKTHEAAENIPPPENCTRPPAPDRNVRQEEPTASSSGHASKSNIKFPAGLSLETTGVQLSSTRVPKVGVKPRSELTPEKSSTRPLSSASNQTQPLSTASNQTQPLSTASNQTQPLSTASNLRQPLSTASNLRQPLSTASNLRQPLSTASNLRQPLSTASNQTQPLSTASNLRQPLSTASNQRQPGVMVRAGEKGFLEEFYSNSRLHHLSTWGSEFKAYVSEIQRTGGVSFPGREKLRQVHVEAMTRIGLSETLDSARHARPSRVVMHIDMDCFFVSVGLLSRPDLIGKPVAVTHSKGQGGKSNPASDLAWEQAEWRKKRDGKLKGEKQAGETVPFDEDDGTGREKPVQEGYDFLVPPGSTGVQTFHSMAEIASCSYEARKAGVKNGMFMGRAMSLCPDLQTIPYNFTEYNRISKILYDLVASHTHDIEAVSCDEMLIDCTDLLTDTGATAMEFASLLRSQMMEKTGCPASAGIGPNILLAKLATRKAKPNGQFEVLESEAKTFIEGQPVSDLPGVGYSLSRKLCKLNVQTCGELQRVPVSTLRREFGPKTGEGLHRFSLGQDDRPVKGDKQRKSVSAEVNYGIRFSKDVEALTFLKELSGEVKRRLDAIQVKGRSITLKLMVRRPDAPAETAKFMGHGICNTINKSTNLPVGTNNEDLIAREVISLYKSQKVVAADVRGIGIQINKLESSSSTSHRSSNVKGHQSILNFAVPSCSKPSFEQNLPGPGKKESSEPSKNESESTTLSAGEKPKDLIPVTSGSKKHFTPSLFSSSSSAASSSSSNKFTSMKKSSMIHRNLAGEKYPTQALSSLSSGSPSFGLNGSNATSGACYKGQSYLDTGNSLSTELIPSRVDRLLPLDKPGPSKDQSAPLAIPGSSKDPFSPVAVPGPSTRRSDGQSEGFAHLSLSQIDCDILKELPEDIAQEVLAGLTAHNRQQSNNEAGVRSPENIGEHQGGVDSAHSGTGETNSALPSLSQLNMSCFEALPANLQEEIRAEYVWQEKKAAGKIQHYKEENYFTRLTSPRKDQRNRGSGGGGRGRGRRGRPPGKKKLSFTSHRLKGPDKFQQTFTGEHSRPPDVIVCEGDDESTNDGFTVIGQGHNDDKLSEPEPQAVHKEHYKANVPHTSGVRGQPASLCGAVRLEDVRNLVKEWLRSGSDPQTDDLELMMNYLTALIHQRNLECAFALLKLIHRHSFRCEHYDWRICLQNLVNSIQGLVCANYGACLKL